MFTFNGQVFKNKTAAAVSLFNAGKSVSESAKEVGISYQTVYVNTIGENARKKFVSKLRAKKLLVSKRGYSKAEISRRCGLGYKTIQKIFKTIN